MKICDTCGAYLVIKNKIQPMMQVNIHLSKYKQGICEGCGKMTDVTDDPRVNDEQINTIKLKMES